MVFAGRHLLCSSFVAQTPTRGSKSRHASTKFSFSYQMKNKKTNSWWEESNKYPFKTQQKNAYWHKTDGRRNTKSRTGPRRRSKLKLAEGRNEQEEGVGGVAGGGGESTLGQLFLSSSTSTSSSEQHRLAARFRVLPVTRRPVARISRQLDALAREDRGGCGTETNHPI